MTTNVNARGDAAPSGFYDAQAGTRPGDAGPAMVKAYDPAGVEQPLYDWWEAQGYFKPNGIAGRRPFVISMPPPNITGELHLGHALTATIEDLMIRWHRMLGDPTLWVPGSDHASIAVHYVIDRGLQSEDPKMLELLREIGYPLEERGLPKTRWDMGRDWFLALCWAWKDRYGSIISRQHRRLGASCDWERERFTMDPGLSHAVRVAFVRLYERGLIYRGEYMTNWCPRCQTVLSDLEVEHEERTATIWTIRYPAADGGEGLAVATTRPETMLGDVAVAVHPEDARFSHLHGKTVVLPVVGRHIPVVVDEAVKPEFGTGAVKVTPAHDPTDYEIGKRHHLPALNVLHLDGTLNANAGAFAGLDRFEARRQILAELERQGLLLETAPHTHAVGHCQRCGTVVEPMISTQWFANQQVLAEPAIQAVRDGTIRIVPERFDKTYYYWMENIQPWCISRQLWWGHRIPVFYCRRPGCEQVIVSVEDPPACPACGGPVEQDPDVLDTWFSSGLWPFSTLGWPEETEDLKRFFPTSVLETGYDILFFWVARMIMQSYACTGREPFHTVYLHGMIRDEHGEKMSKTKGNVIDPLQVMDRYGTDALRFALATGGTPGNDMRLSLNRVESARNFANKLWNAAAYVVDRAGTGPVESPEPASLGRADAWILARYNRLVADVNRLFADYQFGEAGRHLYEFLYADFCDEYLEQSKVLLQRDAAAAEATRRTLRFVLEGTLRLLHPTMPFVTEAIWQHLTGGRGVGPAGEAVNALIVCAFPQPDARWANPEAEADLGIVNELARAIRAARAELGVDAARRVPLVVEAGERASLLEAERDILVWRARLDPEAVTIVPRLEAVPPQAVALPTGHGVTGYLPLAGLFDVEAERRRLQAEAEHERRGVEKSRALLANQAYLAKAPAAVVEKERARLVEAEARLSAIEERLRRLG